MKSHLFRFFTWLCMKTSVVSRRRFCVSISSTFYTSTIFGKWNISTHCQLYALGVPDGLRQLTLSLGDQGYLYFCIKMNYWVPCIYDFRAHKFYSTYCDFLKLLTHFFLNCLKVDYQHSETQATALMVASGRGCSGVVEQLLNLGANPHIKEPKNGW